MSKVLGKGAGTDSKVLGTLIDSGNKMLAKLNSDMPAEFGGDHASRLAEAPGNQLTLYSGFFRQTPNGQAQITAHESHHHGVGGLDIELRRGSERISPLPSARESALWNSLAPAMRAVNVKIQRFQSLALKSLVFVSAMMIRAAALYLFEKVARSRLSTGLAEAKAERAGRAGALREWSTDWAAWARQWIVRGSSCRARRWR